MRSLGILLAACVFGGGCVSSRGPYTFTVVGRGVVPCVLDTTIVSLRVNTSSKKALECQAAHAENVRGLRTFVLKSGHPEEALRFRRTEDRWRVSHAVDEHGNLVKDKKGKYKEETLYSLQTTLVLAVDQTDDIARLLAGLRGVKGVFADEIQFLSSEREKAMQKARSLALEEAQRNAELMAEQLGLRLGKPVKIVCGWPEKEEKTPQFTYKFRPEQAWGGDDDDMEVTLMVKASDPEASHTARVAAKVTYAYWH